MLFDFGIDALFFVRDQVEPWIAGADVVDDFGFMSDGELAMSEFGDLEDVVFGMCVVLLLFWLLIVVSGGAVVVRRAHIH